MKLRDLATPMRRIDAGATLEEAARAMDRFHVGTLVVFEDGLPHGMVSDRDIALHGLIDAGPEGKGHVRDCMRVPLVELPDSSTVGEAAHEMRTRGVRRLALRDGEGELVGVVSADDLLQAVGHQIGFLTTTIGREFTAEAEGEARGSHTYGSE